MMIRCIAIDDEPLALELLEDNISKLPYLQLVASFSNPLEAMKLMQQEKIDLVFLDIQMPGLTGLQFIQSMTTRPMFILITAYEKYALEGYNLDVVDYLVKPVAMDRFIKACNKAWELFQLRNTTQKEKPAGESDHFFVNVDYSLLKVSYADVTWIEGLKDYVKIHLNSTTKPVVTRMSMKTLEDELPPFKFIRIHKSYIISRDYITSVKKNSLFIGSTELPIGESYKDVIDRIIHPKS
jgi:two-component system, LytTR family, response regulator